jgi:hypothetical protein
MTRRPTARAADAGANGGTPSDVENDKAWKTAWDVRTPRSGNPQRPVHPVLDLCRDCNTMIFIVR